MVDYIGRALFSYIKDRVLIEKMTSYCLFYGPGGMGKTFAGAVPIADYLDLTFEKNWQERFIFGDQREKYANFLDLEDKDTFGKAFIQDEIGIAAFSEDHGTKDVKRVVKTGELRRRKYAFVLGTLTDISKLTSGVRHQFDFIFQAIQKNVKHNYTTYRVSQVVQVEQRTSYGEPFTVYNEYPVQIPREYWKGTPYEGHAPKISKIDIGLVRKSLLDKIEPVLNQWKHEYDVKIAGELRNGTKKTPDIIENIANKISQSWDSYFVLTPRGKRHLDRQRLMNDFALSTRDVTHVLRKVQEMRLNQGFKNDISSF